MMKRRSSQFSTLSRAIVIGCVIAVGTAVAGVLSASDGCDPVDYLDTKVFAYWQSASGLGWQNLTCNSQTLADDATIASISLGYIPSHDPFVIERDFPAWAWESLQSRGRSDEVLWTVRGFGFPLIFFSCSDAIEGGWNYYFHWRQILLSCMLWSGAACTIEWLAWFILRRTRRLSNRCQCCGYSRVGASGNRCPECGSHCNR